jgi:hypothetical protein
MKRSHWIWVGMVEFPQFFLPNYHLMVASKKDGQHPHVASFIPPNSSQFHALKAPNHRHAQQLHAGARHHRQEGAVVGLSEDIPVYQLPASGAWREEDISGALGSLEIGWERKSHSSLH